MSLPERQCISCNKPAVLFHDGCPNHLDCIDLDKLEYVPNICNSCTDILDNQPYGEIIQWRETLRTKAKNGKF